MRNNQDEVLAEFDQGSWAFVDKYNPSNRVRFDQALMDVVRITANRVYGYVKSVHGIDQDVAKYFDADTRSLLGVGGHHRLGRVGTLRRVRLMPDGAIEQEGYP